MSDSTAKKLQQEIIIKKKVVKGHGGGHHGGAWKVAYADFITAMMALFLVLWLVAILSTDAKKSIAEYFRSYTIFKGTEAGGAKGISMMQGGPVKFDKDAGDVKKGTADADIAAVLTRAVNEQLYDLQDQVMIFTTADGIRLELIDSEKNPMFELGAARTLPGGQRVLKVIATSLKEIPNKISIEGHTDRSGYQREDYTNWELAADRANAARRELLKNGIAESKIIKVTSFADLMPVKENPMDPLNRRISILVTLE